VADRERIACHLGAIGRTASDLRPGVVLNNAGAYRRVPQLDLYALHDSRSVVRSGSLSSTASTSHGRLEESNPDYVREVDGKKQYLEEKLLRFLE
jgi:hypothetical protein